MQKWVAPLAAFMLLLTTFNPASATSPPSSGLTTVQEFKDLQSAGIFNGFPDGSMGLNQNMTRAQLAKVLALTLGLSVQSGATPSYSDTSSSWASAYIEAVTNAGLMNGVGMGKFDPAGQVTLEQLAKVLDEVLKINTSNVNSSVSSDVSNWAKQYVAAALKAGLIPPSTNFTLPAKRSLLVQIDYTAYQQMHAAKKPVIKAAPVERTTSNASVTVQGEVSGKGVHLTVQGKSVPLQSDGSFDTQVSLATYGINKITLVATNSAGTATTYVTVDHITLPPPQVVSPSPASIKVSPNAYTRISSGTQTVTFTVYDGQQNPMTGIHLTFGTTGGFTSNDLSATSGITNSQGEASVTLSAPTDYAGTVTAEVSSSVKGQSGEIVNSVYPLIITSDMSGISQIPKGVPQEMVFQVFGYGPIDGILVQLGVTPSLNPSGIQTKTVTTDVYGSSSQAIFTGSAVGHSGSFVETVPGAGKSATSRPITVIK